MSAAFLPSLPLPTTPPSTTPTLSRRAAPPPHRRRRAPPRAAVASPPPPLPPPPPTNPSPSPGGETPVLRVRDNRTTTYLREMVGEGELLAALAAAGRATVVVKFYAPFCRACKAVGVKMDKLSKQVYGGEDGAGLDQVVMYEVDISDERNVDFYKKHNVTRLPTFRFYKATEGVVEDFTCSPSRFGTVRSKLREHLGGETGF